MKRFDCMNTLIEMNNPNFVFFDFNEVLLNKQVSVYQQTRPKQQYRTSTWLNFVCTVEKQSYEF